MEDLKKVQIPAGRQLKEIEETVNRKEKFTKNINIGREFIYADYMKTHLEEDNLVSLLKKIDYKDKIEEMFTGKEINFTENRKVLHVALRDKNVVGKLQGANIVLEEPYLSIYNELQKIRKFTDKFLNSELIGVTGRPLRTVVNIGIGGSDLGPRMVCHALQSYKQDVEVHFISNVDPTDLNLVFEQINPEETLFIVVSKTFTTAETIANATHALSKCANLLKTAESEITKNHFVAVSANTNEVKKFGIENIFTMWDFVGGRYSLWSSVGLIISLYIGFNNFLELLAGASVMDEHFRNDPIESNIPILHAVVELFYNNECGYNNKCVLPYDQYLLHLPAYLQQAEMESNGKSASREGKVNQKTGMIIWGGIGTNSQHSFFQLLHQGTRKILAEFLLPLSPLAEDAFSKEHHAMLVANCLAQSRALMIGRPGPLERHFDGNKPSITLCYSKLTPEILGALIALYEHKIFIQGIFWNINSFDQFGVELGKHIALEIYDEIRGGVGNSDNSTKEVIKFYRQLNK
ncbi:putative glucose-6-phosphate isomerase [Astathelohania contejeani]|uniref:Glucose-6-phosphate isomerase n=1 Tax=Astathelohania contejeani TaxID=164912 RepID=A0ABQ7I2F8_9MICR|nr:putative glucose-6-phosphate isomerase [Thelohania contejeani]